MFKIGEQIKEFSDALKTRHIEGNIVEIWDNVFYVINKVTLHQDGNMLGKSKLNFFVPILQHPQIEFHGRVELC